MKISGERALAVRMHSLLLADGEDGRSGDGRSGDVAEVVAWFGAMQAQDLNSALWSFGTRLPGQSRDDVIAATERREALRTWPMRGTIHFVPAKDAHWMLELMGVRALANAAGRRAQLGLTEEIAHAAVDALGAALAGGRRLTRSQCLQVFAETGLGEGAQFGYHLLWYASQQGVTCIAPNVGNEQSFVLLDEWVTDRVSLDRDEALATIATRYFRSHGPAPRKDFTGWTGLTATDAKRAVTLAGDALTAVDVDGVEMFADPAAIDAAPDVIDEIRVLPGFDEYLLGFKDRSLMLAKEHAHAIVPGNNGVFRATIVRDGRVIATWTRSTAKTRTVVTVAPLVRLAARDRSRVEESLVPYAEFIGAPLEVTWT